jgi:diguanylate cyclase (GGDEF)-like protein
MSLASCAALLVAASAAAALLPWHRSASALEVVALVGLLACLSRVQFEIGPGAALPTQLALVPMFFVLPAATVPLVATAGYVVGGLADVACRRAHPDRLFVVVAYSWHALGPALVLSLAGDREPRWSDWLLYLAALAAQLAFDAAAVLARDVLALGVPVRELAPFVGWAYAVDVALAPVGLLAAFASASYPYAFLLVLPVGALLALFARDRRRRIDAAIELAGAFRQANREARIDALTGVGNRLAWHEELEALQAGRAELDVPVSLILVDLDELKRTNDTRGHGVGDSLLRAAASVLLASVRSSDLVARIGGDEFGILLRGVDESGCADSLARLEAAIALHPGVDGVPLSIAIGHASCPPAASVHEAQHEADSQMYAYKRQAEMAQRVG